MIDEMSRCASPAKSDKNMPNEASSIIVTVTDDTHPSLFILNVNNECDLKAQSEDSCLSGGIGCYKEVEGKGYENGDNSPYTNNGFTTPGSDLSAEKIHRNLVAVENNKQSLKHLSASAPAMRTDLGKTDKGDFFMAPSSSKSRQKKFHRHFQTVPPEEKVLDYYSCALVGDILLQGFLYISENYFAFYSNVFGYVTKLLIPITTVVNITKERTAKIFPNAVGIQTQSERHVFASLISRDTTFKLMYKVWMHNHKESSDTLIIPKDSDKGFDDTSGDIVIADDSSGDSGSGNDSALEPSSCSPSPQSTPGIEKLLHHHHHHHAKLINPTNNNNVIAHKISHSSPAQMEDANNALPTMRSDPVAIIANGAISSQIYLRHPIRTSITTTNESNLASLQRRVDTQGKSKMTESIRGTGSSKTPSLLILATALLVILFISAAVLLLRISNLQQKLQEKPGVANSEQFYQDLITWQNRLHSNSAEEIHQFIDSNLQQIVKVRESLEASPLCSCTGSTTL